MNRLVIVIATVALAACSAKPGSSTPKGGAGACQAHAAVAACQDASGCRWLEPGCADGDNETALPADATGCYPEDPCGGASCIDGRTCREVVINPCLPNEDGVACDACGETLVVCLPAAKS